MFNGDIIAVAFIAVLVSANVLRFAEEIRWRFVIKAFTLILVIAGIYCFIAGVWMAGGWSDPLAPMTAEETDKVRPMSRGRGGILILIIQFWPYVLMLAGAGAALGAYGVSRNFVRSTNIDLSTGKTDERVNLMGIRLKYTLKFVAGFLGVGLIAYFGYWLIMDYKVQNPFAQFAIFVFIVLPTIKVLFQVPGEIRVLYLVWTSDRPELVDEAAGQLRGENRL